MTMNPQEAEGGVVGGSTYRPTFLFGEYGEIEGFVGFADFVQTARELGYSDQPARRAFLDTTPYIARALEARYHQQAVDRLPEGRASLPEAYPEYPVGLDVLFNPHRYHQREKIFLATQAVNAAYWQRVADRPHGLLKVSLQKTPQHFKVTEALLIEHDAFEPPHP